MSGGFISNDEIKVADALTLTASYVASTAQEYRSNSGLSLIVNYAAHASSASAYLNFLVEVSYDGTTYVPYSEWTLPSAGVRLAENTTFKVVQTSATAPLTLDELRGRWFRVKVKEVDYTAAFFGAVTIYAYPHAI